MARTSELASISQAALIQFRVIGALVMREMRVRYGRSQFGYLWALVEPAGYIAAMTIIFSYAERPPPFGHSMPLFFALGVVPFRLYMTIASQLSTAMQSNQALLTYPIVKELDTVLARFILEMLTGVVVFASCILILMYAEDAPPPRHILRIVEGFALLMLLGLGIGLTNAVIVRWYPSWLNIYRILTAPAIFLSGVFYSLEQLPTNFREILVWNPLIHGVEIVRDGYYAHYRSTGLDEGYLFAWGLAMLVIGLFAERFYRQR